MAPSPEYDKEPKAPDKSATNITSEDSKLLHNLVNDQLHSSDHKTTNAATNSEVENNKHVETLDDDKLRALLNEALTYKCPKDREGKSSLFKELLEEVEQDDQEACEAAARTLTGCRGSRRGTRGGGRPALPHSNSLQDLVAALAAEPTPRRHRHHATPTAAQNPSTVAARALHGGSLPSGVDTSSMLSEDTGAVSGGARAGGYLATVRCVNPPPLAERRVSASDANAPIDLELLNRRSKPMFPMTYTARATLEIGSGSVCSGRAVTTTTASNQVRTSPHPPAAYPRAPRASPSLPSQARLLSAICPETCDAGGGCVEAAPRGKAPRGPRPSAPPTCEELGSQAFVSKVDAWYAGLAEYTPRHLVHRLPPPDASGLQAAAVADVAVKDVDSKSGPPTLRYEVPREDCVVALQSPTVDRKPFEGQYSEKYKKESLYTYLNDSGRRHSVENAYRVVERQQICDSKKSDIRLRKTYRERIVPKVIPNLPPINPRNIRNMSIGEPSSSFEKVDSQTGIEGATRGNIDRKRPKATADEVISDPTIEPGMKKVTCTDIKTKDTRIDVKSEISESMEDQTSKCFQMSDVSSPPAERAPVATDANAPNPLTDNNDIELEEIVCHRATKDSRDTGCFSNYLADQQKLFRVLEATDSNTAEDEYTANVLENNNNELSKRSNDTEPVRKSARDVSSASDMSTNVEEKTITQEPRGRSDELVVRIGRRAEERAPGDRYILAELPNNAYVFLTLPKRLITPLDRARRADLAELEDARAAPTHPPDKAKKKKDKPPVGSSSCARRKDTIDKNALRALLFENLLKSDSGSPTRAPAGADTEVDSAIPFSCITTPEVVASCNTTPSAAHAAAVAPAADPKPLDEAGGAATLSPAPAPPLPAARPDPTDEQPRSVTATTFNGLPLARPGYSSAPTTSGDDYKKSLDENGNSVQGYGSPLSGSSQHKKPRRKKSSKNETVIDCRQLDGYQGHKDVNELLRFIESDRAPKLRKHKDDSDDKGKKRSADRRKHHDHSKPARASSLEELSRTTLEELTARAPPAKPERRSWGEAAPPTDPPPPPPAEQADFQTVTKKRKPRRRTEEAAPRRARAPSPRPADSAPPSDRSNDSNDDMESVHSLPERAPPPPPGAAPPAPHASYADIARTRHNIPDLIESCNFYAEGEGGGCGRRRAEPPPARPPELPPDADGYPALDGPVATVPRRAPRDKPPPPGARRKERPPAAAAPDAPADCPAPDVVSDRRPPVILLDSTSRPRDMDGVTFGFDINEQLLGGGARRPRCDLVRDAVEAAPAVGPAPPAPGAVPVRAAKRALRYVPPPPPPDHTQLHQIVDFIGGAWEDVVRCGAGKVRYFSE